MCYAKKSSGILQKRPSIFDKKMQFFFDDEKKFSNDLVRQIARCCVGLVYISETDSPIKVFTGGTSDSLDTASILAITRSAGNAPVLEVDVEKFFLRLTKTEAWHNAAQRVQTKKFLELEKLLEENLHGLKVFKIGRVNLTIYAVGLDHDNNVVGISMRAVET
jgi:hypothetical protein